MYRGTLVKGKKYEEIYGIEKSKQLKKELSKVHKKRNLDKNKICTMYEDGISLTDISNDFNCSRTSINTVLIDAGIKRKINTQFKKGNIPWHKGKTDVYTEETIQKIRNAQYNQSQETREKRRNARLLYIKENHNIGIQPCVDKYEISILDILEKCFNYKILRQYKISGYFLDGYCPALNLAIEVDEKHHKRKEQLRRDVLREQEIMDKINCNFLRIDV